MTLLLAHTCIQAEAEGRICGFEKVGGVTKGFWVVQNSLLQLSAGLVRPKEGNDVRQHKKG